MTRKAQAIVRQAEWKAVADQKFALKKEGWKATQAAKKLKNPSLEKPKTKEVAAVKAK